MKDLLKRFKIYHEKLNDEGLIVPEDPQFWEYLGLSVPPAPLPVVDVFHEVVGVEEDLFYLIRRGEGEVRIPLITRTIGNTGKSIYFNLTIIPWDGTPAIVVLEDETPMTAARQEILQYSNLITLLKHDLEKQNAELETQVRVRTQELQESRLSIILTLAKAAEFRDLKTGEHISRIGHSCLLIGKKMGLSANECELLFHASLLHDIGKIGIPDSILLKPGSLTPEEWGIMKTHTTIGYNLLGESEEHVLFKTARDVAKFHHERWDGKGYPEGLKGEKIPLAGRICAVADVFDALISLRPYKEAWSVDRALEEIKKESGSSFDPSIGEAFFGVVDDIVRLRSIMQ